MLTQHKSVICFEMKATLDDQMHEYKQNEAMGQS